MAMVALAVSLGSCESFQFIEPEPGNSVLAIGGLFETNVPWSITVEATVPIGTDDSRRDFVADAEVTVTNSSGEVLQLPYTSNGRYGAALRRLEGRISIDEPLYEDGPAPLAGETYELQVTAPGFEPLTARSRTPDRIQAEVELLSGWAVIDAPESATDAVLGVSAGVPVSEFYELRAVTNQDGIADFVGLTNYQTNVDVVEEASFFEEIRNPDAGTAYFVAFVPSATAFETTVLFPGANIVGVYLRSVSDEYFFLRRSQERRRVAERNPFQDPPPLYSNVTGGVGVFAGTTLTKAKLTR